MNYRFSELWQCCITTSDNTAAKFIAIPIGGPEGLTHFLRSTGDVKQGLIARTHLNEAKLAMSVIPPLGSDGSTLQKLLNESYLQKSRKN
ncbi:hypothetical protein LAD64_24285 [Klebsiella pneumoniae]|nr:hypothetical protein [Klebsiella pneumoniae]